MLQQHPDLATALHQVAASGTCDDERTFYRLVQAGLVRGASAQHCDLRCALYGAYLREALR
jgi:hypothetical protein